MSMTVNEALQTMTNENGKNRFNKKNFTDLMTALANDQEFVTRVAKVRNSEIDVIEKVAVSKGFREFCKKILYQIHLNLQIQICQDFTSSLKLLFMNI